jgi:hypothetical protein
MSFQSHVELLEYFLARRHDIVERIQGLLNAQRKPAEYLQDADVLSRDCEACFFSLPGVTREQASLQGQLEELHWADGFKPRHIAGLHNGLIDPAEMMIRAFHLWRQTRWPGRNARLRYAHALFNLYVIRGLMLLSLRIWDAGSTDASARLSQIQRALDRLWTTTARDQPVLIRDARWLTQLAQSPATDELRVYFDVIARIDDTLSEEDRLEIHRAGARMAGGHLRSQLRHYTVKNGVSIDDRVLVLNTRTTNALDFALLVQDLVPLLEAYESAVRGGERDKRIELAAAICQAISPDPELFVNRVELLAAYSMIEDIFVTVAADGHAVFTPQGQRHVRRLQEYRALIGRLSQPLLDDCSHARPVAGAYSPYGVIYGFSVDLVAHMVFKALLPEATTPFSFEDVFSDGDADKLAWVSGWRKLPHLTPEVAKQFDYPQQFAEAIFGRIERVLQERATGQSSTGRRTDGRSGRLFIVSEGGRQAESTTSHIPDLPTRYIGSSDAQLVASQKAHRQDQSQIASDRREGRCLVSVKTAGGWVAITKAVLSELLEAGQDAKLSGLPASAVEALKLMYPDLVILPTDAPPMSSPAAESSPATDQV